ncbi:MAG: C4-dicarboxylate ABC transporter permease, partial [Thermotogae bacterium]
AGLIAKMNPSKLFGEFVSGARGVTYGALIIGFARAIVVILSEGRVLDTIIHGLATPLGSVGAASAGVVMFLIQSVINFFIGSGSGQAAATMPIMTPLADLIGLTRQTAVLAYQFGDGITNMFYPAMIYYLVFADIPYDRWVRHIWKLVVYLTIAGAILVAIAGFIHYGPY